MSSKCVICCLEIKRFSPPNFCQVDYVDDQNQLALVSNYYQQRLLSTHSKLLLNDPICMNCVDVLTIMKNDWEPETDDYRFIQEGYVCVNTDLIENYQRNCGRCNLCNTEQIRKSKYRSNKNSELYLMWNKKLISRAFPCVSNPQVFIKEARSNDLVKIQDNSKPLLICGNCFNEQKENWVSTHGTVQCYLCKSWYQRYIFHHVEEPVYDGCGCDCFEDTDGRVWEFEYDYHWIHSNKRPAGYDKDKIFCDKCLKCFIKEGYLKSCFYSDSDDDLNE